MNSIIPVIMAGGSGTRLWPLSRSSYPKQFTNLIGQESLFQKSAIRLSNSDQLSFTRPITVTNSGFRFIVAEQLQEIGIDPGPIIIEPEAKNTAPAILAATIYAFENDNDAILLASPSDHVIPDTQEFHKAISKGLDGVLSGNIVTFGIQPTHAETGYGYLSLSQDNRKNCVKVKKFIEKPDLKTANSMIDAGTYLWNAGIFMFRAKDLLEAFERYASSFIDPIKQSIKDGENDLGFFRLGSKAWSKCDAISIDYALMENISNLVAVPFSSEWSDLGDWNAVWTAMLPDQDGVAVSKNAHARDCRNSLLRSESSGQTIVGLGLENIIAIAMPDCVLVADKNKAQNVKSVVSLLKESGVKQAEDFPKVHRPWGWYETLVIRDRFQVKRIHVKQGASLSLQSHNHRSEHWVVVHGTAKVTVNDTVKLISEGQSIYVPVGAVHRMENPGKIPMLLIEVQTGSYLEEDDIIRYEDVYSRV